MGFLDSITNAVSNLGGGLINSALSIGKDFLSNQLINKPNAASAFGNTVDSYKNRYQWTMEDMRKAGLNPILAATGGFNVGSGPIAPMAAPPSGSSYSDLQTSGATVARTDQQIQNLRQELENKRQSVIESIARTQRERAVAGKVTQEERNLLKEFALIEQKTFNAIAEYERISAQAHLYGRQSEEVNSLIKQIETAIKQSELTISQLGRVTAAYTGPIGSYLGYIKAIVDALGLHTSAGAGVTGSVVRMVK